MADVFRGDATFKELVSHFVASRHIRKADSEIGFAVMGKVKLLTVNSSQFYVYPTLL